MIMECALLLIAVLLFVFIWRCREPFMTALDFPNYPQVIYRPNEKLRFFASGPQISYAPAYW